MREHMLKRLDHAKKRYEFYKIKDNSSKYGYWCAGYWLGKVRALEDMLDKLEEEESK
ncbi:hypothetical protein [Bacillus cereus]|uniref:hypothetical protein n=1 Tax=Bacillus cereus TaxID=1396 RepID=UPI0015CF6C4E|nr:hypothetical protein [Bacillus cereus]